MPATQDSEKLKRKPVNLTIREDLIQEAKNMKLNTSRAAEAGILAAIRQAHEKAWLEENEAALNAHNARIEKNGTLLRPEWIIE